MSDPLRAVAAGHLCLDIFPGFEHLSHLHFESLFKPGRLIQVGAAQFSSGGLVSNAGLALHHLGIPTRLIGKVGGDPFGKILIELISKRDPRLVEGFQVDTEAVTSYSIIISNQVTDRMFLHCTGANDSFTAADIDYHLVEQSALFHFGYPPILGQMFLEGGKYLVEVMQKARATGVTTSLDMTLPDRAAPCGQVDWRPIYQSTLPYVDIFLPSLEEILFTLRRDQYEQMSQQGEILDQVTPDLLEEISSELMEMGVKVVIIKLGACGIYLRTGAAEGLKVMGRANPLDVQSWANCEKWVPCFKVNVVGTTGAGDSAIAGFLSAFLRRYSPEQALSMAVAAGACNVEAADSLSGLRTWEATLKRVEAGWEQIPLQLESPGWHWDAADRLWIGPLDKKQ
jgi:sugar/nucleoside kinase (ribokinase family)